MRTILFLVISVFFIAGCSFPSAPKNGKEIEITNAQRVYTKSGSVSATAPNNFPNVPFEGYTRFDEDLIAFNRHLPNMMSEDLRVTVFVPEARINIDYLLDKKRNDDLERTVALPISEWEKTNITKRGVSYNKHYVDYIGGLKCTTNAESSSPALGVGFKKYYTVCGYYDTNGNKKRVDIMYHYISSYNGTKFQSDTTSTIASGKDIDTLFKQDMKAIFDSLVIHDMDREKMSKNGLFHDKKYDVNTEYRVDNNAGQ